MPNFEEVNGIQYNAGIKVVIYGQEGVGKSTLAAAFPGAVFIDCEGSTTRMNVRRLQKPTSWQMLCDEVEFVRQKYAEKGYQTLIFDTFDWAERLALDDICATHKVNGIEGLNYGKGWEYEKEMIGRFLDATERLTSEGVNVVFLCHAIARKTTAPEVMEEYDHWELKLGSKTTNKIAPLLKEWSDMTLFLAFRTNIIATDDKGKKHKATSTERVMYTTKSAWWDAKNRFGLPEVLPIDFNAIAHILVPASPAQQMLAQAQAQGIPTEPQPSPSDFVSQEELAAKSESSPTFAEGIGRNLPAGAPPLPKKLADLMNEHNVKPHQIEYVSADVWHYFAQGQPMSTYPADYHDYLTANWGAVLDAVKANCRDYVPFD
ncbi:MAG: ATP-binding protein [Oscillospiraceae bacterium]|nr:ATP-binding protein [Oscillospiraceae bacterium]